MIGFRPISWLGAELTYFDLGHPEGTLSVTTNGQVQGYPANASFKGEAAFGMIYLPIPLIDVYAKVGVARAHSWFAGLIRRRTTYAIEERRAALLHFG